MISSNQPLIRSPRHGKVCYYDKCFILTKSKPSRRSITATPERSSKCGSDQRRHVIIQVDKDDVYEDKRSLHMRSIPVAMHACYKRPTVKVLLLDTYVGMKRPTGICMPVGCLLVTFLSLFRILIFGLKAPEKALMRGPCKAKGA